MIQPLRSVVALAATVAAALAVAPSAGAQVTFTGTSNAYFNDNTSTTTLAGLSFSQGFGWGGFTLSPGESHSVTFGNLFLDRSKTYKYGDIFNLVLNFTQPGAGTEIFRAALAGNINKNANGNLDVDFGAPLTVTLYGSVFTVEATDLKLKKDDPNPAAILGRLTLVSAPPPPTTVTPEPVSMVLLGSGLAGLGAVRRRRARA